MTRTLKCVHPIIGELFPLNSTSRRCKGQNSGSRQGKERLLGSYFVQRVHALLAVTGGSWLGVAGGWGAGTGAHHAVGGTRGRPRTGTHHGTG